LPQAESVYPDEIDKGLAAFDRLKPATAQELVRFHQLR
jgi:hypothetical protein